MANNLSGTSDIVSELEEILKDKGRLEKIGKESYIHDNGFVKIKLFKERSGRNVRIHIFPENEEISAAENFHDHRWAFHSSILVGKIRNENAVFERTDKGNYIKWSYNKQSDGSFSLLPTEETWRKVSHSSEVHTMGDTYNIKTGMIHRIIPTGIFTATLVVTEPASSDHCFQWAHHGHDVGQNGENQRKESLSWLEVRRLLVRVVRTMKVEAMIS